MKWKMIGIRDCIRPALGRHQCRRGQYIVDTQRYRDLASCHSQGQLERSTQSADGSNQKSIRQSFRQQTVGGRERYIVEISYHQYRIRRLVYFLPDSLSLFVSPFVLALQEGDDLSKPSYTPHCRGVLKRVKIQPVGLRWLQNRRIVSSRTTISHRQVLLERDTYSTFSRSRIGNLEKTALPN